MIESFISYIPDKNKKYVIFDIGSRDCLQSIEFYNNFPNAIIYAFECNPNTLDICRKNIENYKDRITLIEGAVCDHDGEITFYPINQQKTITTWADGNPGASSLFKSNGEYDIEIYVQDEIKTNSHRLDSVMKLNNITHVDILWMDLQGAELLALKGLGVFIHGVEYIYTEVSHKEIYTGQVMFKELNEFMVLNNFIIKNNLHLTGWQEDAIYQKHTKAEVVRYNGAWFDIVILLGPNDVDGITDRLTYTKTNIIGYRNIYIISFDDSLTFEGCITISEKLFPFSLKTVSTCHGELPRNKWYLQQLLKLYAGLVIPNILENYLAVDADVYFLKPTHFCENDKILYNYYCENHEPYYEHMQRLHPSFKKVDESKSGICHHMLFQTKYIKELFALVETAHNNDFFYNIFLKAVTDYNNSGASEYEIYFNYILQNHSDTIKLRKLKWENASDIEKLYGDYDYLSFPHYMNGHSIYNQSKMYLTPFISATGSEFLSVKNTGLGNVMFQIASCYGLAKKTDRLIVWNNLVAFANKLLTKFGFNHKETIFRKCLTTVDSPFTPVAEQHNWEYDPELIKSLKNNREPIVLSGYLECTQYFHQYKPEIMEFFVPDDASLELIRKMFPVLFDDAYTTVSIHFRGNEYLHNPYIGSAWDYDFYKRAIAYFKEKFTNCIFLIFSDDMESIDFTFLANSPYIKMGHMYDYIDLWCLTLCKHNIVSRSTFSFWGGYLNKNPDAIVLYNKNFIKQYHSHFQAI